MVPTNGRLWQSGRFVASLREKELWELQLAGLLRQLQLLLSLEPMLLVVARFLPFREPYLVGELRNDRL